MADFKLPVSFYFSLSFTGLSGDAAFQEASGLSMEMTTEEVSNGGENRFKLKLPGPMKFNNLVLKRGLIAKDSKLTQWCTQVFSDGLNNIIKPKDVTVSLLDAQGKNLVSWDFLQAYPVKWSASDLKSMENSIVIETLEFAYTYLERK